MFGSFNTHQRDEGELFVNEDRGVELKTNMVEDREEQIPPFFAVAADNDEAAFLSLRARKFRALASLFRLEVEDYPAAVRMLLEPCPDVETCPVAHGSASASGLEALQWAAEAVDDATMRTEHLRLFGGPDRVKQMPIVSPCGAAYMSEDYDGDPSVVAAVYDGIGFEPRLDHGECPVHISNELDFMAHCFEAGDRDSLTVAHAFIVTHLFSWGVVFAAAVYARSEHPVTRFGGTMLEHMMFCELEHARDFSRAYRFLARSAVAS